MTLEFIEKVGWPDGLPFSENEEFDTDWWRQPLFDGGTYVAFEIRDSGFEVARLELDFDVDIDHYVGTPQLGDTALEIQFIEVASSQRGRGVGTTLVQTLAARYPNHRLLAFSEEADGFWASLGWQRYDHLEGPTYYRPLFIQPHAGA